jgi:hypothetical protein
VIILIFLTYLFSVHYLVFLISWLIIEFSYIVLLYYILQHKPSTVAFIPIAQ